MAYSSRLSQILTRSITTGDFYTGLKYLKIPAPTSDQPTSLANPPLPDLAPPSLITGCRTTSRQAVKKVAITGGQVPIRKTTKGDTVQTISPSRRHGVGTRFSGAAPVSPTGPHAGTAHHRAASSFARHTDRPRWNGRAAADPSNVDSVTGGGAPTGGGKPGGSDPPKPGSGSGSGSGELPKLPDGGGAGGSEPPNLGGGGGGGENIPPKPPGDSVPPSMGGSAGGTPSTPMVRPKLQLHGIIGAYAGALYSAASKNNKLEIVEQDLIKIRDTFKNDTQLRKFLLTPDLNMALKLEGIQSFKKLNISDLSLNLLVVITQNRRMKKLLAIIAGYLEMMAEHKGIVECAIVSARPLKPTQKEKLLQILGKMLPGKTPHTVETVDPTLIGGFILLAGQQHINMSMKRMFNQYEQLIKTPVM